MTQSTKSEKTLDKSPVSPQKRKFERNEDMENRLSFFSSLAKIMLENPTKDNLEALQREDKALSSSYLELSSKSTL
ncbi:hypothetical protein [Legionella gresilensis]|uniref:hypothetical protein n=1 Tax=Legionella gresilensis TaxID=91823 RepID=UPI0010411DFA|nr:hypothetical protein [Legionella gresilensis]